MIGGEKVDRTSRQCFFRKCENESMFHEPRVYKVTVSGVTMATKFCFPLSPTISKHLAIS